MIFYFKLKRKFHLSLIFIVIFLLITINFTVAENSQWDNDWSFSKKITIPFDTSLEISKYQPIDMRIDFEDLCWAKNEIEHSIRVCCWDGISWNELESQIYSLKYENQNIIKSCNVVFLIPEYADGKEEYFIFYDDSEKPSSNYFDHVDIEDSFYNYEPIPGYPLESYYYKIIDDDYITYAVSYDGQFMGYNTCQHVTKMKPKTTEVLPKNGELFAAFDFKYCYDDGLFDYSSTSQKLISKEIFVDGNLMLEFGIISSSKFDDLQTTTTYKYYHCPGNNYRMHANVKHETLKEINIFSDAKSDGTYTSLQAGGVKSRSISDLNIGNILPYMHFFSELETISEYDIDIDPEYRPEDPDIRIISLHDDVDLGTDAWISFDEGKTGQSHSIIFNSNNVISSGSNERDGIQLNAFEMDYPHLSGLENNIATMQVCRNSVESGENHDLVIPNDFVVEFDAEFFSSESGGYSIIGKESEIFRELVKLKPREDKDLTEDLDEIEKFDLSVYVHHANSVPMGSTLSALLGLNLSYVSVELYRLDEFIYSETATRVPMNALEELENPSFLERIIATLKIFDLRNISFFKKAIFPEIEKGKYVIKIFKENPGFSKERQYIGYEIVDLQKDEKIHVLCRSETSVDVFINDQNAQAIKDAEVFIKKDNQTIAKHFTDEDGKASIKIPISFETFDFLVVYNDYIVHQEPIKLKLVNKIISLKKTIDLERYNFNLLVKDTWGKTPEIDLNPMINVKGSKDTILIRADKIENDNYIFRNLTPNTYQLSLTFKSFVLNKEIEISKDTTLDLEFPAEYKVNLNIIDSRGSPLDNSNIVVKREDKKIEIKNKKPSTSVIIPPGKYGLEIYKDEELIGVRNIDVYGEQKYDLVTNYQPVFPIILIVIFCLITLLSFLYLYFKKNLRNFYLILVISLILTSIFLPWWEIYGSEGNLVTSTKLYLIPKNMITITSTDETIAGELSFLPFEFTTALNLMILSAIVGCFLILFNQFLKNKNKKRLHLLSKTFSLLSIFGTLLIFLIAINELCRFSIGSVFGSGYLDIGIPGGNKIHSVLSNWGPGLGFYIYLVAVVIIFVVFTFNFVKTRKDKMKDIDKKKNTKTIQHPLFGISTKNWIRVLNINGGVDNNYLARGIFVTFTSILTYPARLLFKIRFESKIKNHKIKQPPVIIIGHWRSGTSYLHELISQDPQFCYVSLWNTLLPDSFLVLKPLKNFFANFLPPERPMDSIKVDIDGPYEEEAGIAVLNPWSFFHGLHFARNAEEQYLKSIHFDNLSDEEKDQWKKTYEKFMKTISYSNNGKRLLLKNPANTARIRLLQEIFPDAFFIHIYRNPYKVYLSNIKMRNKVLDKLALQNADKKEIEKQVIKNYKRLMNSYFEQKNQIPKDKLIEIRYEDLVEDPIKQVKLIYSRLKISGFNKTLPEMKKYIDKQKEYKVNVYSIDKKIIEHVTDNWKFTIDLWGYKPPK